MNSRAFARFAAAAVAVATASGSAVAAGNGNSSGNGNAFGRSPAPLEGSWEVTIRPHDCVTGVEAPAQFWNFSYLTFSSGGTMFEMTSNPRFQPGQRSPGYGYWERTGVNTYDAVFQAFILFTTDPPNPSFTRGSQRFEQTIELTDADHWQSAWEVTFRDVDGNPVSHGCASASASRMP